MPYIQPAKKFGSPLRDVSFDLFDISCGTLKLEFNKSAFEIRSMSHQGIVHFWISVWRGKHSKNTELDTAIW